MHRPQRDLFEVQAELAQLNDGHQLAIWLADFVQENFEAMGRFMQWGQKQADKSRLEVALFGLPPPPDWDWARAAKSIDLWQERQAEVVRRGVHV